MSYKIVTDSSCNLSDDVINAFDLTILPLTFRDEIGNEYHSYQDNHLLDMTFLYDKMREGTVFKTSLPALAETDLALRGILDAGHDVLYLGFSSGLPGTAQATATLMEQLKEEYPERTLLSFDMLAAAGGQGLLVLKACEMMQAGASIEEVHEWAQANYTKVAHWFTVEDLIYLFRGGRVSRTSAFAGNLLHIKPVLHVDNNGLLIPMEKVRGRKKSLTALLDHMKEKAQQPVTGPVVINHGDCLADAELLADKIRAEFGDVDIRIELLDPIIGAHTGPGLIALFYWAEDRD